MGATVTPTMGNRQIATEVGTLTCWCSDTGSLSRSQLALRNGALTREISYASSPGELWENWRSACKCQVIARRAVLSTVARMKPTTNSKPRRHLASVPGPEGATNPTGRPVWLTLDDLTEVLGVSKWTLYAWHRRGYPDFPKAVKLPNGQVRVLETDLVEWMNGRAA